MDHKPLQKLENLDLRHPIWERFFWVSPLAVIGTLEPDGRIDFAPKHMVTPMGWENYFGFVCTPRHSTYVNIERDAAPRCGGEQGEKPMLETLQTRPATVVKGHLLAQSYLFLECEQFKIIDGFGENSLITGKIVAAHIARDSMRTLEHDGQDLIRQAPLLAYLPPARFATVQRTFSFPFPAGFKR